MEKLTETKKLILKKKILMSFIIDNYSTWDKILKYSLLLVACLPVVINVIVGILQELDSTNNTVIILLNTAVIFLIKMKDKLKFDKIKDVAKDQSIKYTQLYDKIENYKVGQEMQLHDFLYWISREFGTIELNDPSISHGLKIKFKNYCKNIGVNIDMDNDIMLYKLLENTQVDNSVDSGPNIPDNAPDDSNNSIIIAIEETKKDKESFDKISDNFNNHQTILWAIKNLQDCSSSNL